jgi:hypothetical protein
MPVVKKAPPRGQSSFFFTKTKNNIIRGSTTTLTTHTLPTHYYDGQYFTTIAAVIASIIREATSVTNAAVHRLPLTLRLPPAITINRWCTIGATSTSM